MILTQEEFAAVAAYEKELQVAVRSKYLRNVGRSGLEILVPIYERASGARYPVNPNCAACILGLLERLGAIYFADKEERRQSETATDPQPAAEIPGRRRNRQTRTRD